MFGLSSFLQGFGKLCRFLHRLFVTVVDISIMGESKRKKPSPVRDNVRTRFYSEGSAREAANAREGAQELPDLVLDRTFRDRANSAPSRPSQSAIEVGRELRRISDEFESTFYQQRGRSNSILRRLVGLLNRDQGAEERQNQDHRPNAIGSGGGL